MPPEPIISQNSGTLDSNFVAALTLYSHKRDMALGLNLSRRTAGLAWHYSKRLSQELNDIAKRSFLVGVIEGGKARMAEILTLAPMADNETKKRLLLEAKTIEAAIQNAARVINGENS